MIDESTSVSAKIDQYFEWSKTKIAKKNLAQNKLDEEDLRFIAIASTEQTRLCLGKVTRYRSIGFNARTHCRRKYNGLNITTFSA